MEASRYPDLDDLELEALGCDREMPQQLPFLSQGALSFTLTCTCLGTGSSMGINIPEASAAGTIWSLPIAGIMTRITCMGMIELVSAYPVAGAQYHWSSVVVREDYKLFAAAVWVLPRISCIGGCMASSRLYPATAMLRKHREPASWVCGETTNLTGRKNDSFAFVLSVSNAIHLVLGSSAGAHLCDDILNPGRNVRKVIMYPVAMELFTAFPFACACIVSITDKKAVPATATGLPMVEIYY